MAMNNDREVTFEIVEEIGVISAHPTGWNKEINLVSWNGNTAKYDIRDWSPNHDQMGRGITLHEKEMRLILELLRRRPRTTNRSNQRGREDQIPFMADKESAAPATETEDHNTVAEAAESAAMAEEQRNDENGEAVCGEGGMEWTEASDAQM